MTNKERLYANNEKIKEITKTLAKKQVSPTDMLQARVDETKSCNYLFYKYKGHNSNIVKNLNTSNATDMTAMFSGCSGLTSIDLSNFDTSNVKGMSNMFMDCYNLTSLDVRSFDTSNVTNMTNMFNECSKVISLDVSNFNTSNVNTMYSMFYDCRLLTTLDVSNFDTRNVTSMYTMFGKCEILTSLNLSNFNTSNVKSMAGMFRECFKLTNLDLSSFDTSNVTNISNMFNGCGNLQNIIGVLNLISCTQLSAPFFNCKNLTTVTLKNIKKSLTVGSGTSYGTLLTDNTIINTFKELHDLTGSTSQTLTLSTPSGARTEAIYVKLVEPTEEQITADPNIIYKKNCVVCESTDEGAMTLKEYGISKGWAISY